MLLTFNFNVAYAQLHLNNTLKIQHNDKLKSLSDFVKYHQLDYALISWSTSSWINRYDIFNCLFKKDNQWSLVEIKCEAHPARDFPYELIFKQKVLNMNEAESLLVKLKLDSTFSFKQDDFNKLPESCEYELNGKKRGLNSVMDASTDFLAQFEEKGITELSFYATYNTSSST